MYYNGKKGMHTTVFLNEVHARVYQKYITQQDQDVILAKKLQDFFQNLKNAAKDINSLSNNGFFFAFNIFTNVIYLFIQFCCNNTISCL